MNYINIPAAAVDLPPPAVNCGNSPQMRHFTATAAIQRKYGDLTQIHRFIAIGNSSQLVECIAAASDFSWPPVFSYENDVLLNLPPPVICRSCNWTKLKLCLWKLCLPNISFFVFRSTSEFGWTINITDIRIKHF